MRVLPTIPMDYPDPDVIRVEDTYYMVSTTMHFMPGCEILESKDLREWKHTSFVYDILDSTPGQKLRDGGIYGKGMWAATIRYHRGMFYILFVANDTHKTYLYRATDIRGPWMKSNVEGFFHDASLLFDDDRVFIVSGNRHIRLTELDSELKGPLEGGFDAEIVTDNTGAGLGYEGSHLYKINGRYYLFLIHSRADMWKRVESCYVADKVEGPYTGGDIFDEDLGYFNSGIAQGGIVDTPDGGYYAMLFQDRGAAGRMPYVLPADMSGDMPVIKKDYIEDGIYSSLCGNDGFTDKLSSKALASGRVTTDSEHDCFGMKSFWQFNHEPELSLIESGSGCYSVTTDRTVTEPTEAINTLTQRLPGLKGTVTVTLDASKLNDGDVMGLCALQYLYLFCGIRRTGEGLEVFTAEKEEAGEGNTTVKESVPVKIENASCRIRMKFDFENMRDEVCFLYEDCGVFKPVGQAKHMRFSLKHFVGVRAALVVYSTEQTGGRGAFSNYELVI